MVVWIIRSGENWLYFRNILKDMRGSSRVIKILYFKFLEVLSFNIVKWFYFNYNLEL